MQPTGLISCFLFFLISLAGTAQYVNMWDIGAGLGGANYLGEIGGKEKTRRDFVNDIHLVQTRPAFTLFARYSLSHTTLIKGSLTGLRIQGADNLSRNPARVGRNLHFRNDIIELATTAEFNFYQPKVIINKKKKLIDYRAYLFFGVAAFYHNPQAQFNGQWIDLQPLRTEGQITPYSRFQMSIPMGIGFHYTFGRRHRLGWEFGWRMTFTDYLDDISTTYASPEQLNNNPTAIAVANRRHEVNVERPNPIYYEPGHQRGNPDNNDSYFTSTISYSYVIRGKSQYYKPSDDRNFMKSRYRKRIKGRF